MVRRTIISSTPKSVYRSYSNLPEDESRSYNLAVQHIKSGKPTTAAVLNELLINQNVSITQDELDKLINLSFVEFKLPIQSESYYQFMSLIGKRNSRGSYCGVYIFIHNKPQEMYVGSSS